MDASLWQLLSSRSNGDIYKFLDQIIQCIHNNTGSRICLLIAERTDTGFVSHQMHAGKNILGHEFSKYFPQLSGEWESFVRSLSESSKHKDDVPLLEEYDFESKNQEKKSQLRKFFHDVLKQKMASKGLKFARLPWRKLCSNSESYILPGCLPHGFQLKAPELLRVEEVADLWKYIYQHQQSDELTALHFTDEVFKFDRSMRDEVQSEKSKGARVKNLETKGGSRPDTILGMSEKEVGQQTAAPIEFGNGEPDISNVLVLDQQGPSDLETPEKGITTGIPLREDVSDVVDDTFSTFRQRPMTIDPTEDDRPDNVNQQWQSPVEYEASMTPAHNTEDPASNPEPSESIKRQKRKAPTPDSFECRPHLAPKRRKPSAADTEDWTWSPNLTT